MTRIRHDGLLNKAVIQNIIEWLQNSHEVTVQFIMNELYLSEYVNQLTKNNSIFQNMSVLTKHLVSVQQLVQFNDRCTVQR